MDEQKMLGSVPAVLEAVRAGIEAACSCFLHSHRVVISEDTIGKRILISMIALLGLFPFAHCFSITRMVTIPRC